MTYTSIFFRLVAQWFMFNGAQEAAEYCTALGNTYTYVVQHTIFACIIYVGLRVDDKNVLLQKSNLRLASLQVGLRHTQLGLPQLATCTCGIPTTHSIHTPSSSTHKHDFLEWQNRVNRYRVRESYNVTFALERMSQCKHTHTCKVVLLPQDQKPHPIPIPEASINKCGQLISMPT